MRRFKSSRSNSWGEGKGLPNAICDAVAERISMVVFSHDLAPGHYRVS